MQDATKPGAASHPKYHYRGIECLSLILGVRAATVSLKPMVHDRASKHSSPSNSNSGDVRRQSTAFRGASRAIHLAAPASPAYVGINGALAAATSAGMGMRRQEVQLAGAATSNCQRKEEPTTKTLRRPSTCDTIGNLREQSPSYAAALHAICKSTPASTQKSLHPIPDSRRPPPSQNFTDSRVDTPAMTSHSTDEASVGATSSLVSLFESKQNPKERVSITQSVRYVTKPTSEAASPIQIKPRLSTTSSISTFPSVCELKKGFTASGPSRTIDSGAAAAAAQSVGRARLATTRSSRPADCCSTILPRTAPETPAPRPSGAHATLDTSLASGSSLGGIAMESGPLVMAKTRPEEPSTSLQTDMSDPVFLPLKLSPPPPSRPLVPIRYSKSFETKVDSLANTIVAASLASSRAASPTKPPLPPPPRRHNSHSLFNNHHSHGPMSRTPSPAKAMRQTMREQLPSDDEAEYKKKSVLMRKHPHKHHEGDRKRYRATVTERERRRYDGVWAANKGLWMDADSSDRVLNLVVRDIWSRSRLSNDVLADIWDLVNNQGGDRLERNEFVIGMWLIDQRLKGRKLRTYFRRSIFPSSHQVLSLETCLETFHPVDVFQGSLHPLK